MLKKTKDLNLIHKLDQACFNDYYSLNLLNNLDSNHHFYLLEEQNAVVGFIIINQVDNNICELIKIGILNQYQHKGYAFINMNRLLKILSFEQMFLEVDESNIKAIKLYNKLGFKVINIRKHYYKNGNNALIFCYKKQM